jgi:hypothetical protein
MDGSGFANQSGAPHSSGKREDIKMPKYAQYDSAANLAAGQIATGAPQTIAPAVTAAP